MNSTALARAAVALGSNISPRLKYIEAASEALANLPLTRLVARSEPIETDPLPLPGGGGAASAGGVYLNAAALLETALGPRELLDRLMEIERSLGRTRDPATRWGPRTIDLDLILHGERVVVEPGLRVPHPRMSERRFVLEPLAAVAPGMIVPPRGLSVAELLARLSAREEPAAKIPGVVATDDR